MTRKTFEPIVTKQTMNRVTAERMPFKWSINPYRGCAHGCSFCYARAFQSFIGMGAEDEFQSHILLKTNAAEALEDQLSRMARRYKGNLDELSARVGLVALGTATDPYQPIEGKAELTRQCLRVLSKYRIPVTITTRSPLILRDLDLLREMRIATINISINTLNAEMTRKLEPASPFPIKRLEAMAALSESGIRTGIFAAPILPYLTDGEEDLDALFAAAKEHGAEFAMTSLLRLSPDVKAWFYHSLKEHFPKLLSAYLRLYPTAYAERAYADSLAQKVNRLLERHELSGEVPTNAAVSSCPASRFPVLDEYRARQDQKPVIAEQLTFSF